MAGLGTFAGQWRVFFHNTEAGTDDPGAGEIMIITVTGSEATGAVTGGFEWSCTGPLTENGRVWNAKRLVNGELSLRFDDVRLSPDGNHFRGRWSGEAPHNYAWIGVRVGTEPPPPVTPATANHLVALRNVEVNLQGGSRQYRFPVAPGARVIVRANQSSANPYVVTVGELDRAAVTLVSERTEPVERTAGADGKARLGGPTERRVLEFRVAENARGTTRIVVQLRRPWESTPSILHTIQLIVLPDARPIDNMRAAGGNYTEALWQIYVNAQSMSVRQHFHPVHADGFPVCNADRVHKECYDVMLPIYRAQSEKEGWNLSEEELKAAVFWWRSLCAHLPDDHPSQCGCSHEVPSHSHTGW